MVTVKNSFTDIQSWLETQKPRFRPNEIADFEKAIVIAENFYKDKNFYPTSVDLLIHALTCADKVADLHLYSDAVIATLLYALPKFCENWQEQLSGFDSKVIELVEGVNRVTQIRKLGMLSDVEHVVDKKEQVEVIRKMLLAMASDIRVVLIVLVGRGELMLHLKSCKETEMQRKIAIETVEIFSPLANRLGLWQIKWELEDLSFKYLHPEQYRRIAQLLDETREERLDYIENIKEFLSIQMEQSGILDYQVTGRAKHIYSIWKKMKEKNYDFDDLYDIRALRVLVPEVRDCYTVLGIVHTKYSPIPGEFDDYISNPKPNNYQSLHTCVSGPDNKIVEIQIRTFAMHDHAEYGVAAHWRYKEFGDSGGDSMVFAEKVAWIRQLLDWREELTDRRDITNIFKNEIFNDMIYVMTPKGRVISLPKGSTPIDFAYAVHSDIGHKCRGAKINGHIVPLSTQLQNGQRVEVLTVKEGAPSINWLHDGFVKSSKAISHIRRYIRNQNHEEFLISGSEIFERELAKFPASRRPSNEQILSKLGYTSEKILCVDLGRGDLSPAEIQNVINIIREKEQPLPADLVQSELERLKRVPVKSNYLTNILVDGVTGIVTYIAKCCKPIPGDEIIGFITQGKGVAVHRGNCKGVKRQAKITPNKVVSVEWGDSCKNTIFTVDIEVIANDYSGLLRNLTDLFAMEKLHINGLRTVCKNNKAFMIFTVQIKNGDFNFAWLINKIYAVRGVIEVVRK